MELVQEEAISFIGQRVAITKTTAPNMAMTQYVSNLIFFILICGKNNMDRVIPTNVKPLMMIVAIIQVIIMDLLFYKTIKNRGALIFHVKDIVG